MNQELIRKVAQATRTKETRQRETLKKNQHAWAHADSMANNLPGKRGIWTMAGFDNAGNATDTSGLAHHMQYNGNPTYNYDGLIPYIDLDGTGDFLSVADHADYDIIGTESYVAPGVRGLTLGGWFWADSVATPRGLFTKGTSVAATSSYELWLENAGTPDLVLRVSTGAAYITVILADVFVANEWAFCVGRYDPSAELKVWHNEEIDTQLVAVPASINNSAQALVIGAFAASVLPLDGRASHAWICAEMLSDDTISALYQQSRAAYGV